MKGSQIQRAAHDVQAEYIKRLEKEIDERNTLLVQLKHTVHEECKKMRRADVATSRLWAELMDPEDAAPTDNAGD